jgi:hypothetical protein
MKKKLNILKKLRKTFNHKDTKKSRRKRIVLLILIFLGLLNIYNISKNYFLDEKVKKLESILNSYYVEKKKIKIDKIYFNDNFKLKDYINTKYKIKSL